MEVFFVSKFTISLILIALIQLQAYKACFDKQKNGLLEIKSFFIISIGDRDLAD